MLKNWCDVHAFSCALHRTLLCNQVAEDTRKWYCIATFTVSKHELQEMLKLEGHFATSSQVFVEGPDMQVELACIVFDDSFKFSIRLEPQSLFPFHGADSYRVVAVSVETTACSHVVVAGHGGTDIWDDALLSLARLKVHVENSTPIPIAFVVEICS